ncbi:MAG: hypothetical protein ABIY51_07260 [Ferruginibacter sp.]
MKYLLVLSLFIVYSLIAKGQSPCTSNPVYRQFDYWIGNWEAFGTNGKKAGDSKISLILDSCIVLEEWISAGAQNGLTYKGKSFNTFNASTKQWQQTWVDNVGGSTEYLQGKFEDGKMIFQTNPFPFKKDTLAVRRLSFFNLGINKVRQLGEISKNGGVWFTEYDLEYRRKM